jgi:hypothetical protein
MTTAYRLSQPHEVTADCAHLHCYSHDVDELRIGQPYIVCGECFHVYATAGALRRAYRRVMFEIAHGEITNRYSAFAGEALRARLSVAARVLWQAATVRASKVSFCQHCTHDF